MAGKQLIPLVALALTGASGAGLAQSPSVPATQDHMAEVALQPLSLDAGATNTAGTSPAGYLDGEAIARSQAGSVNDLLRGVPAVGTSRRGNALALGVTMRGFGGDHHYPGDPATKIVVDGVGDTPGRHYQAASGSVTDPALLRSVEVTAGPLASLEFGSGITGGAISARTLDGSDLTGGADGFKFRQLLGASSNGKGSVSSSTLAWQANSRFDILVNFTRRQQDTQQDGSGTDLVTRGFNLPSLLVKARLKLDDSTTLSFSHNRFESAERNVPGSSTIGIPGLGVVDRDRKGQVNALTWSHNPAGNELLDLELKLSRSDQEHNVRAISGGFAIGNQGDYRIVTDRITLTNTAAFRTGSVSHSLRAGLAWSNEDRTRLRASPASGSDRRLAAFAINTMDFGNDLRGTIGLRLEDQKLDGTTTSAGPFNNLARTLGAGLEKGLGYGLTGFGSVTYTEGLPGYDLLAGGSGGKKPQSRNYEIGVKYAGEGLFAAGDRLTGSVSHYQNYVWNAAYNYNRDLDFRGFEMAADYRMASGTYLRGAVKLTDLQQKTARGGWALYEYNMGDSLQLTLGHKFASGLDLSWHSEAQKGIRLGSGRHAGFGVHDLKASYTAIDGVLAGLTVDLGLENIFDRKYSHSVTPLNSTTGAPYVYEPGRNLRVTLSKTF